MIQQPSIRKPLPPPAKERRDTATTAALAALPVITPAVAVAAEVFERIKR